MIVTLTHYQARTVMSRVSLLHADAMGEHRVPYGPKAHSYDLPAIAWKQIRDHLYLNPLYYGPLGGKLDSQPKALYRAIQLIHKAVLEMEHHPAFANMAVTGVHMQVVPAFVDPLGASTCLSPYPFTVEGMAAFVLLVPRWREYQGTEFTEWDVTSDPNLVMSMSWTFNPHAHLDFLPASV